jgi:uncharacterized protein (TIRG00374 family)
VRQLAVARYGWVAAAAPLAFILVCLDALRLHLLMRPQGYSGGWRGVFKTNLVVNMVSLFLPGTIGGGAIAWYRLSQRDGLRAQTFAALSLNTLLKSIAVAAPGAFALALDAQAAGRHRAMIGPLIVLAALPVVMLFLMLWTTLATRTKAFHVRFCRPLLPRRLHEAGTKVLESIETYRSAPAQVLAALGVGLVRVLAGVILASFCLRAVGVADVAYARLLWIMCAVEAAGMMPFTLAGWGLPQVAFVGLLAAVGVAPDLGLAAHVIGWVALAPVYLTGSAIMVHEAVRRQKASTSK